MAKVKITKELREKYKRHPRILEVRLILLFDMLEREFGYNGARDIFMGIAQGLKRNKDLLDVILSKRFDIKRKAKTNIYKWRQEVMFMGICYGDKVSKIAKDYMSISPVNMYRKNTYSNPDEYITDEWLRSLDEEVYLTGSTIYRNEVSAYIDGVEGIANVLSKWNSEGGYEYVSTPEDEV